jgi:cold shock CspA family protein
LTVRLGHVVEFDEARGLGLLRGDDGEELAFHCTSISDGTRTIEVGRCVAFLARPARLGEREAFSVTPLSEMRET